MTYQYIIWFYTRSFIKKQNLGEKGAACVLESEALGIARRKQEWEAEKEEIEQIRTI